ncbi:hypothetical protein POM88_042803 [Heracleum sosnowskyi]|uniref:Uncharacterized protein n=1 Tax=Heracleum sosnowskyi TaxID=360622 RepID=A0AAD8HJA7_9APIA|nr:hypothetical protein POM88_042803 [Heracleum sosnowskyi]
MKIPLPDEKKKKPKILSRKRPYAIDASVVRIMKNRKILEYQQLDISLEEQRAPLKEKMIMADPFTSNAQPPSGEELTKPLHLYAKYSDTSEDSDSYDDEYPPEDDFQLLDQWSWRPLRCNCVDKFHRTKIYEVKVKANSCTVAECLELLKRIGRENRFIARSVESARLFFAELNKEDAHKLKGLDEICYAFPRDDRAFHL